MRVFHCDHCGKPVFFENTRCSNCDHLLAYMPDLKVIASLDEAGSDEIGPLYTTPLPRSEGRTYRLCRNYTEYAVCNWAAPSDDPNPYCRSCRLTRVIPDLDVPANKPAWFKVEQAKRRLIYSLMEFELPVRSMKEDPAQGLAFEFKADPPGGPRVLTGHGDGVITLNIDEADDVEREKRRLAMREPYRTLLGHFRHEIGHYYWDRLVQDSPRLEAFREMFGDETVSYDAALKLHYDNGPRVDWQKSFVSAYASVHPWEDWAETFAHYLHMTDCLETAAACGLSLEPPRKDEPAMPRPAVKPAHKQTFSEIIDHWFPLTYVLNSLNRGMGMPDAYPFVLTAPAVEKLRFVHETVCLGDTRAAAPSPVKAAPNPVAQV